MREAVVAAGGQVHFGSRVVDIAAPSGRIEALEWVDSATGERTRAKLST